MEFHFTLVSKSDSEIEIMMYHTQYKLVKISSLDDQNTLLWVGEGWTNAANNKMIMSAELVNTIIEVINAV